MTGQTSVACVSPVLSILGIHKSFGSLRVLTDVTVDLNRGEIAILRGENGSGKTTLVNLLTGYLTPDRGSIRLAADSRLRVFRFPQGFWKGISPLTDFAPERVARAGLVRTWQDLRLFKNLTALQNLTVAAPGRLGQLTRRVAWGYAAQSKEEEQLEKDSKILLNQLGFTNFSPQSAGTLSLGESKKLALARALRTQCEILVLDEPLSGLDQRGIADMLKTLALLKATRRVTMVIVEHALNIKPLIGIGTRLWTLSGGHIGEEDMSSARASVDSWLSSVGEHYHPNHFDRSLASAGTNRLPSSCLLTSFTPQGMRSEVAKPILRVERLSLRRSGRPILGSESATVSFQISEGALHVLEAPNGWGKTSLLETMVGMHTAESGMIYFGDTRIDKLPVWDRRNLGLAYLPNRNATFRSLHERDHGRISQLGTELIGRRVASRLSGGQQKWMAFSCAISAPNTKLLLADEPLNELDHVHSARVWSGFAEFVRSGGTVLMVVPSKATTVRVE